MTIGLLRARAGRDVDQQAQRRMAPRELGELVVVGQGHRTLECALEQLGSVSQDVGESVDDHARLACLRGQSARDDAILCDLDQCRGTLRHNLADGFGIAGRGVRRDIGELHGAQIDVQREQLVRFDRQVVVERQRCESVGDEPLRLA